MTVRILTGDCRHVLAQLPANSIHCVVTSPPYWGLRDYQIPPDVWGGDAACEHEWITREYYLQRHSDGGDAGNLRGSRRNQTATRMGRQAEGTCRHCGGWRGVLGLEPLHDCGAWAWGGGPCNVCYVCHMRVVFAEVWRVLRDDGTLWLNLGDSYYGGKGRSSQAWSTKHQDRETLQKAHHQITDKGETRPQDLPIDGLKPKDLAGIPWRVALALQADGWYLRMDMIWHKLNPMPESVTDRPTKAHEYIFILAKSRHYFYDALAISEPAQEWTGQAARFERDGKGSDFVIPGQGYAQHRPNRPKRKNDGTGYGGDGSKIRHHVGNSLNRPDGRRNRRSVLTTATKSYKEAHFAVFPPALPKLCIQASTSEYGCCRQCGAGWERTVERTPMVVRPGPSRQARSQNGQMRTQINGTMTSPPTAEHTGWQPTCRCDAGTPIPCTVLDPFGGSGTTGLVADRLGRDAILIELNEEYAEMARRRIAADAGMFANVSTEAATDAAAQLNLF